MNEKVSNINCFVFLQIMLLIFSFGGVLSKIASGYDVLSINFIFFYAVSILTLFIYSIGWQFVLRKMDLTLAFSCKAMTMIWGMLWGVLFFNERITCNMIFGAGIIVVGILLVVSSNK